MSGPLGMQPGLGVPSSAIDAAVAAGNYPSDQTGPVTEPDVPNQQDAEILTDGQPTYSPDLVPGGVQPVIGGPLSFGAVTRPSEVDGADSTQPVSSAPQAPMSDLDRMRAKQLGQVQGDADSEAQAVAGTAGVTQRHYQDDAALLKMRSDLNMSWAAAEQKASSEAKAESAGYVNAYKQQIAAVRQMAVDPTGPIGSLSVGGAAGLSLAMFAQGFLAVRGINIDVAGQVDRWVQRSIHEQERRIGQAEAGANDQLHLWEIAKQTSRDDLEARQRYQGFVSTALQSQIEQHAALYQSSLANAQAAEKVAQLQTITDGTSREIENNHYRLVHQDIIDRATVTHMAAENALLAAEAAKARAEALKAASDAKADKTAAYNVPITDPEDGKAKWLVNTKLDATGATAAQEAGASFKVLMPHLLNVKKAYQEAYGAYRDAGSPDMNPGVLKSIYHGLSEGPNAALTGAMGARLSEKVRNFDRARKDAEVALINWGHVKRFNESEMKEIMAQMPGESAWQEGSNAQAYDDLIAHRREDFQALMDQYDLSHSGATASPRLKASIDLNRLPPTTEAEQRQQPINADLYQANQEGTADATPAFKALVDRDADKVNAYVVPVEHLALGVLDPDAFRAKYGGAQLPSDNAVVQAECRQSLEQLAHQELSVKDLAGGHKAINSGYADKWLYELDGKGGYSPEELRALLLKSE